MSDGLGAAAWIDVQVNFGKNTIDAGTAASSSDGKVVFEIGRGLVDSFDQQTSFTVDSDLNSFNPHQWDESDVCLGAGATELYLDNPKKIQIPLDDTSRVPDGKWMLLQTTPLRADVPARAWMVRVIAVEDIQDKVFNTDATRIRWEPEQATPFELDLTVLQVHGSACRVQTPVRWSGSATRPRLPFPKSG
jgi:hypothetical protein